MSRAAARDLRIAMRSLTATMTSVSNANATRELTEAGEDVAGVLQTLEDLRERLAGWAWFSELRASERAKK